MTGINEKGLMVSQMWLDETKYPPADTRPVIGILEWIQYNLDRHCQCLGGSGQRRDRAAGEPGGVDPLSRHGCHG